MAQASVVEHLYSLSEVLEFIPSAKMKQNKTKTQKEVLMLVIHFHSCIVLSYRNTCQSAYHFCQVIC